MASSATSPRTGAQFKRRVFFVTDLGRDELMKELGDAVGDFETDFEFSEKNGEDAEFIVFDLSHLPKEWGQYLGKDRRRDRGVPVDVGNRVPFFFITLGSETDTGQVSEQIKSRVNVMRESMEGVGIEVQAGDMKQIIKQLRWFQSMMPFYRKEPPGSDTGREVTLYAVSAMKKITSADLAQ